MGTIRCVRTGLAKCSRATEGKRFELMPLKLRQNLPFPKGSRERFQEGFEGFFLESTPQNAHSRKMLNNQISISHYFNL